MLICNNMTPMKTMQIITIVTSTLMMLTQTAGAEGITAVRTDKGRAVIEAELDPSTGLRVFVVLGKEGENLVVTGILPDSVAAWSKAIRVGDHVIEVAQENMQPVQVKGLAVEEAVRLIRGPKGVAVRLTILPAGKEERQARVVSFVRGELKELSAWGDGVALEIGTKAPNIQMVWLEGKTVEQLTNYAGKVVVLEFWATWCAPCQKLMTELQTYPDKYPDWKDKVVLTGASVDEKEDTARRHLKVKGWKTTRNVWVGKDAVKAYHVNRLPTTYIIDQRGNIAAADCVGEISEVVNRLIRGN